MNRSCLGKLILCASAGQGDAVRAFTEEQQDWFFHPTRSNSAQTKRVQLHVIAYSLISGHPAGHVASHIHTRRPRGACCIYSENTPIRPPSFGLKMDNPTHTDAFLNLLSSCFPSSCRSNPPALPPSPRLGALLRDPESDDAMSLHSTYRPHTRQKKKKPAMQLCGINLFGKPRGQIRLEDDDEADETEPPLPRHPRPRYDSDAAPLPDSTIQSLSTRSPTTEQPTRQESLEDELARLRAEKAARKARKRQRKLKRQLALEHTAEFEGFIGSGDGFPISPPSTTTSTPGIEDLMSDRGVDDADPEDGDADMGAAVYTRSTRSRSESGSSATRSSRARDELVPGNALGLGLRGPPSPLAQSHIPEAKEPETESVLATRAEPVLETRTEPLPEPLVQPSPSPTTESKPSSAHTRPKPKIHISDLPLSSPGAGPGPRTLENSPRLASKRQDLESQSQTPTQTQMQTPTLDTPKREESSYGFPSPRLSLPSPRLGLPPPSGFPSPGLRRLPPSKGFPSPGLARAAQGVGLLSGSAGRVGVNLLSPTGLLSGTTGMFSTGATAGVGMQVLKGVAGLAMGAGLMAVKKHHQHQSAVVAGARGLYLPWASRLLTEEESDDEDDE
ncbi:hypothetical protein OPQ81_001069 [Rhizoctonia solani]|nr:hypothetical protein OPQ81_001069 [Rhizoctonia solani]